MCFLFRGGTNEDVELGKEEKRNEGKVIKVGSWHEYGETNDVGGSKCPFIKAERWYKDIRKEYCNYDCRFIWKTW